VKPTLSTAIAVGVFRYGFRSSWKVALLAGAATLFVTGALPVIWQRKDEQL
jgi:hypothetical protein